MSPAERAAGLVRVAHEAGVGYVVTVGGYVLCVRRTADSAEDIAKGPREVIAAAIAAAVREERERAADIAREVASDFKREADEARRPPRRGRQHVPRGRRSHGVRAAAGGRGGGGGDGRRAVMEKRKAKAKKKPVGSRWRLDVYAAGGRALARRERVESDGESVLDEVVIDEWLHLEQMDARKWWASIGDVRLWITIGRDGKARVTVERDE